MGNWISRASRYLKTWKRMDIISEAPWPSMQFVRLWCLPHLQWRYPQVLPRLLLFPRLPLPVATAAFHSSSHRHLLRPVKPLYFPKVNPQAPHQSLRRLCVSQKKRRRQRGDTTMLVWTPPLHVHPHPRQPQVLLLHRQLLAAALLVAAFPVDSPQRPRPP